MRGREALIKIYLLLDIASIISLTADERPSVCYRSNNHSNILPLRSKYHSMSQLEKIASFCCCPLYRTDFTLFIKGMHIGI